MVLANPNYPLPPLGSFIDNYFGYLVPDPLRSLEDIQTTNTRNWIDRQKVITDEYFAGLAEEHSLVKERLAELWHYPKYSVFSKENTIYFTWGLDTETTPALRSESVATGETTLERSASNRIQNQAVLFRMETLAHPPVPVLDPNLFDISGNTAVINQAFNQDATLVAYAVIKDGSEWETVHIRNTVTGADLPEVLTGCKAVSMAWGIDSTGTAGFYYNRFVQASGAPTYPTGNHAPRQVLTSDETRFSPAGGSVTNFDSSPISCIYWHQPGTPQSADKLFYAPNNIEVAQELNFYPKTSFDGRYLVLYVTHSTDPHNSIYYCQTGTDCDEAFQKLKLDEPGRFIFIGNISDTLFFQTTWKAPNGQIIAINLAYPEPAYWQIIVAEQPDSLDFVVEARGKFVIGYLHAACHHLKTYTLEGQFEREIPLPPFTTVSGITGRPDSNEIFLSLESFTRPACGYRYDSEKVKLSLLNKPVVDFKSDEFETEQVFCPSVDGVKIPLFIIHKKGLVRNGANPTLLTGYGGFGLNEVPLFLISHAFWLEQGGILAVANIRGGSENGQDWHEKGRLANKQNSFSDFQTAARYLIDQGYTSPNRLAAMGHSNGGLLTAVCAIQTPHLFRAIVCRAPLTDMLRYHEFGAGRNWSSEYGCSKASLEEFKVLAAYSPIHNIKKKAYPAVMVTVSTGDERVHPMHSLKFVASLQANSMSGNQILLRVEEGGGHGTGNAAPKTLEELADIYTFLFKELNID